MCVKDLMVCMVCISRVVKYSTFRGLLILIFSVNFIAIEYHASINVYVSYLITGIAMDEERRTMLFGRGYRSKF